MRPTLSGIVKYVHKPENNPIQHPSILVVFILNRATSTICTQSQIIGKLEGYSAINKGFEIVSSTFSQFKPKKKGDEIDDENEIKQPTFIEINRYTKKVIIICLSTNIVLINRAREMCVQTLQLNNELESLKKTLIEIEIIVPKRSANMQITTLKTLATRDELKTTLLDPVPVMTNKPNDSKVALLDKIFSLILASINENTHYKQ